MIIPKTITVIKVGFGITPQKLLKLGAKVTSLSLKREKNKLTHKNLNKRITKRFTIAKATKPFLFFTSNFLTKLER